MERSHKTFEHTLPGRHVGRPPLSLQPLCLAFGLHLPASLQVLGRAVPEGVEFFL